MSRQNAPLTNFAVLQVLPLIAEACPQPGADAGSADGLRAVGSKIRRRKIDIRDFLESKAGKV